MSKEVEINNDDYRKIESKTTRSLEEYMAERVQFKINLYFRKARSYRFWHLLASVIIAISAALVPVLVNLSDDNKIFLYLATIFSLLVSIGVALQEVFRFREHWRNYNLIDSNLRSEEMLFSMSAGPYKDTANEKEKANRFVQRIEELIHDERWDTINMRTAANRIAENEKMIESVVESYLKAKNAVTE
ncbi:DUF4231 domain-containing protein [Pricia sp.]|uniref:DUF4231 domain-containing protein n=1 Tax=Pricia sp. TaxID=2268138 RepID=UPI003593FBD8